jgi:hypothetical protein
MEWHSIKRFILESALQQPDLSRFDTKKRIQVHASANFMTVSTSDWLAQASQYGRRLADARSVRVVAVRHFQQTRPKAVPILHVRMCNFHLHRMSSRFSARLAGSGLPSGNIKLRYA